MNLASMDILADETDSNAAEAASHELIELSSMQLALVGGGDANVVFL